MNRKTYGFQHDSFSSSSAGQVSVCGVLYLGRQHGPRFGRAMSPVLQSLAAVNRVPGLGHDPNGPWERFEQPLIDVGESEETPDALMTSNPSLCRRPDGTYLMVYKCAGKKNPLPFGGPVVHMVATSASPTGPFAKHREPVFTSEGDCFPAEDPYIWPQDGKFWAIVKDMHGAFTGAKNTLALFESDDGFKWTPCRSPLVTTPQINWQATGPEKIERLERPQLWLENGVPRVLFCAAKDGDRTFNVHIPL